MTSDPPVQSSRARATEPVASETSQGSGDQAAGSTEGAHVVLDDVAVGRALTRMAHEVIERNDDLGSLYLVGVPNGGVPLARRLAANLQEIADLEPLVGVLDTTLYRDDLVGAGARPLLRKTEMPSAVDDRVVVLVDDVFSTGRTIRAAMDALMDFGRPRAVQVLALIDRGHRELPIKIDYVGKNIPTRSGDRVKLLISGEAGHEEFCVMLEEEGAA